MADYTTIEEMKEYLAIAASDTSQDARLSVLITALSRAIELYCRRHFDLRTETHRFDIQVDSATGYGMAGFRKLWLDDDLHQLTQLVNGDGVTIPLDQVLPYPNQGPPYRWLELRTERGAYFTWRDSRQQALRVTGIWGYQTPLSEGLVPQALRMWVSQVHSQADDLGISNKSIGGFSVSYKDGALPSADATGLRPSLDIALLLEGLRKRDIAAAGVSY